MFGTVDAFVRSLYRASEQRQKNARQQRGSGAHKQPRSSPARALRESNA
jgi:hypothetical protein